MFENIDTQISRTREIDARRELIVNYFKALGINIRALDEGKNIFKDETVMGGISKHIRQWMRVKDTNAFDAASDIITVIKTATPRHSCWKNKGSITTDIHPLIIKQVSP